jgi:DUF4097 and DUF4098 domain-containing protein YvlB
MSARKIGFLILLLGFGAVLETAWSLRQDQVAIGPEGCRVLGGRFYGPSFTFEDTEERALPEGGPLELRVENAFGAVRIETAEGRTLRVKLRKVVYLPTEKKARTFAEGVRLQIEQDGTRVRVGTNREEVSRQRDVGLETHLELAVPPETIAFVRNDHGSVAVKGIAQSDVHVSFDDVHLEAIRGPATVEVRHGAVRVANVGGTLTVTARHGDVDLENVLGQADLDVQHGTLTSRRTGALRVKGSYESVNASGVGGDLRVDTRHGSVTASGVDGGADVETSFGDVHLSGVRGDGRAKTEHGEVRVEDARGRLEARTTFGSLRLERVEGAATATVQHGGVEARSLEGGARVRAEGGDVSIKGFRGAVDALVERGSIRLAPEAPITSPITASASGGDVRLEVPAGSHFDLEALSRHGDLKLDAPGLEVAKVEEVADRHPVSGRAGGGGAPVRLTADGDVVVEPAPVGTTPEAP